MTLTTPAMLFPAISLLFLAYNNRFLALAALIRSLRAEYENSKNHALYGQIANLRKRLRLIQLMEWLGVLAFTLCVLTMFLIFSHHEEAAQFVFGASLLLLMSSLITSLLEIQLSVHALELHLGEVKPPHE